MVKSARLGVDFDTAVDSPLDFTKRIASDGSAKGSVIRVRLSPRIRLPVCLSVVFELTSTAVPGTREVKVECGTETKTFFFIVLALFFQIESNSYMIF
jgi:hypothetical protein